MKLNKRFVLRSLAGAAAVTCLAVGAWAQGTPVKIGLLATLEGPFAAGGAAATPSRQGTPPRKVSAAAFTSGQADDSAAAPAATARRLTLVAMARLHAPASAFARRNRAARREVPNAQAGAAVEAGR